MSKVMLETGEVLNVDPQILEMLKVFALQKQQIDRLIATNQTLTRVNENLKKQLVESIIDV